MIPTAISRERRGARGSTAPRPRARAAAWKVASLVPVAWLVAACSGPSPRARSVAPRQPSDAAPASPEPLAGFVRYPATSAPDLPQQRITHTAVVGGRCLAVTSEGHRLLAAGPACRAPWTCAVERLPPLTAIARGSDRIAFIGARGQVFLSQEPLGEATRLAADGAPRRGVDGAALSVDADGRLFRLQDERWDPVALRAGTAVDRVLATPLGVFALGVPESVWRSSDGGATFALAPRSTPDPFGARELVWEAKTKKVVVEGSAGRMSLGEGGALEPDPRVPEPDDDALVLGEVPRPSALDGAGFLSGRSYWEARRLPGPDAAYVAIEGALGSPLTRRPLALPETCDDVRVSGRGRFVAIACESTPAPPSLVLLGSSDGGRSFSEWGRSETRRGEVRSVSLGIFEDGAVLVVRPGRAALTYRDERGAVSDVASDVTEQVTTGPGGRFALSSRLGGHLELALGEVSDGLPKIRRRALVEGPDTSDDARWCSLPAFDPEGVVGACIEDAVSGGKAWITVTPKGTPVKHALPRDAEEVSGAGLSVVVARGGSLEASRDGGLNFEPLGRLPLGPGSLRCTDAACLMDDGLAWLGEVPATPATLALPDVDGDQRTPPRSGSVISCSATGAGVAIEDIAAHYQPFPQLESVGVDDALFVIATRGADGRGERAFVPLDGQPRLRRSPAIEAPTPRPPIVLGDDFATPLFAHRAHEVHPLSDGSAMEVVLVTLFESDAFETRHVAQYAYPDVRTGRAHAETLIENGVVAFTRRGAEQGVAIETFRPAVADRSWVDATYRPILADGALGPAVPAALPDIRATRRCAKRVRDTTPRMVFEYGPPVSGAGRGLVEMVLRDGRTSVGRVDGVVLQGTRDEPCGVATRATGPDWVAIVDGDGTGGTVLEGRVGEKRLVATPLRCKAADHDLGGDLPPIGDRAWSLRTTPPGKK